MIGLEMAAFAQGLTSTDWGAVSGMTAIFSIVVAVVTAWANSHAEEQRRKEAKRERIRFRQIDRAERQRLLQFQLAADRRERLARNYGEWYRALTATIINKMRAVLAQEAADKEAELAQGRQKEVVDVMSRMHEHDRSSAYGYLAKLYGDVASMKEEASEGIALFLGGATELAAITILIQLDESPEVFMEASEISAAVAQFDGHDVALSQNLSERAGIHITRRVEALRGGSSAQLREGRKQAGRA